MKPIRVPRTPRSSFDNTRPPSKLLLDQIEHLEWAVLPAWQRTPALLRKYRKQQVRSEQQAAERIAQLTRMVLDAHDEAPAATDTRPTVILPPLPRTVRANNGKKRSTRVGTTRKASSTARALKTKRAAKARKATTAKRSAKKTTRGRR